MFFSIGTKQTYDTFMEQSYGQPLSCGYMVWSHRQSQKDLFCITTFLILCADIELLAYCPRNFRKTFRIRRLEKKYLYYWRNSFELHECFKNYQFEFLLIGFIVIEMNMDEQTCIRIHIVN